MEITVTWLSLK